MSTTRLTPSQQVREFHVAFGHTVATGAPSLDLPGDELRNRFRWIGEEYAELAEALFGEEAKVMIEDTIARVVTSSTANADIVQAADATADMRYFLFGFDLATGIPSDAVSDVVHASNMAKLGPDGKPIYGPDNKVVKPEGWQPPESAIVAVLNQAATQAQIAA